MTIRQRWEDPTLGTGRVVWDSSLHLARYFMSQVAEGSSRGRLLAPRNSLTPLTGPAPHRTAPHAPHSQEGTASSIRGRAVLELGSGCGLLGLLLARLGARAIMTDLPELIPLLRENIACNTLGATSAPVARPLDWATTASVEDYVKDAEVGRGVSRVTIQGRQHDSSPESRGPEDDCGQRRVLARTSLR